MSKDELRINIIPYTILIILCSLIVIYASSNISTSIVSNNYYPKGGVFILFTICSIPILAVLMIFWDDIKNKYYHWRAGKNL